MDNLFNGLSVTLTDEDISLMKSRIEAEKAEWIKGAQNDEDFIQTVRNQEKGKVYHSVERWLKKATGFNYEELDANLEGGERFKEMLDYSLKEIKSNKDKTNQELQDELLKVKDELRHVREDEIPEIKSVYRKQFNQKQIEVALADKLNAMNIISERTNPAKIYAKAILNERYNLDWDEENNSIQIKTHKGLEPVINDKTATLDNVLNYILDEGGFIQKSNGTAKADQSEQVRGATPVNAMSDAQRRLAERLGMA